MIKLFNLKSFILLLFLTNLVFGSKFQGYFSTNTYTFSRQNQGDSTLIHTRFYQSVWLQGRDLLIKNSRLNVSGVFYTDPVNPFQNESVYQIYNFNYSTSWFSQKMKVVMGRQFQYSVSDAGRMDGISTNYTFQQFQLTGFIGSYVPATGMTDNPVENHFYGGEILWKKSKTFDVRLGYSDKSHARPVYRSGRRDIEVPPSIKQRIGLQSRLNRGNLTFYVRTRHQVRNFKLNDLILQTVYKGKRNQRLQNLVLEYNLREPRVPENSIFSVFDTYSSQEVSFKGRLLLSQQLTGWFHIRQVFFNNDQSSFISLGMGVKKYKLDIIHQNGYGGSSNRLVIGTYQSIGQLVLSSRISLGSYRLIEGDWSDLSTLTISSSYPIWKKFEISSEIQVLKNKYYTNDTRFQLGMKYRL